MSEEPEKKKFIYRLVDFLFENIKMVMTVTVFIATTSIGAYNKYLEFMERIATLEAKVAAQELEIEKLIYKTSSTKSLPPPNLKPPVK